MDTLIKSTLGTKAPIGGCFQEKQTIARAQGGIIIISVKLTGFLPVPL